MIIGETYHIQCESNGAAPPAIITWWLGGNEITKGVYNTVRVMSLNNQATI